MTLILEYIIKCCIPMVVLIFFFLFSFPLKDLEMENMDQKSSENDSHKPNSEEAPSESQDAGAVSEEPSGGGESSAVGDPDPLSPASADSASVPRADEDPHAPGLQRPVLRSQHVHQRTASLRNKTPRQSPIPKLTGIVKSSLWNPY